MGRWNEICIKKEKGFWIYELSFFEFCPNKDWFIHIVMFNDVVVESLLYLSSKLKPEYFKVWFVKEHSGVKIENTRVVRRRVMNSWIDSFTFLSKGLKEKYSVQCEIDQQDTKSNKERTVCKMFPYYNIFNLLH